MFEAECVYGLFVEKHVIDTPTGFGTPATAGYTPSPRRTKLSTSSAPRHRRGYPAAPMDDPPASRASSCTGSQRTRLVRVAAPRGERWQLRRRRREDPPRSEVMTPSSLLGIKNSVGGLAPSALRGCVGPTAAATTLARNMGIKNSKVRARSRGIKNSKILGARIAHVMRSTWRRSAERKARWNGRTFLVESKHQ